MNIINSNTFGNPSFENGPEEYEGKITPGPGQY